MSERKGTVLGARGAAFALALGLVVLGCETDPAPAAKAPTYRVRTMMASKATAARFGVVRWHVIGQKDPKAFVFDGSDAKGRVRFSMSIQDTGDQLRATSYTKKGAIVLDKKTGAVVSNTLGLRFARMTTAFQLDAAKGGVKYCGPATPLCLSLAGRALVWAAPRLLWLGKEVVKGYIIDKAIERATEAFDKSKSDADRQKLEQAQAERDRTTAEAEKAREATKDDQPTEDKNEAPAQDKVDELTADQDMLDEEAKDEAAEARADAEEARTAADEAEQAAADPELTPEEKEVADEAAADAEQAETEAADEAADTAEDAAGVDAADEAGDAAEDEPATEETDAEAGASEEDAESEDLPEDTDEQGLDEESLDDDSSSASADEGGDETGATESIGICRKASCSKSSRLCACAHY